MKHLVGVSAKLLDVLKDLADDNGVGHVADDLQSSTAERAPGDIDIEHPLEPLHPTEGGKGRIKKERTRDQIARLTLELLLERGYDGTTIEEIARRYRQRRSTKPARSSQWAQGSLFDDEFGAAIDTTLTICLDGMKKDET